MALSILFSNKHATVETTVFGAALIGVLKCKIMFVPISGHTYIYGNNMLVINNNTKQELKLKKKCNSICYYTM